MHPAWAAWQGCNAGTGKGDEGTEVPTEYKLFVGDLPCSEEFCMRFLRESAPNVLGIYLHGIGTLGYRCAHLTFPDLESATAAWDIIGNAQLPPRPSQQTARWPSVNWAKNARGKGGKDGKGK